MNLFDYIHASDKDTVVSLVAQLLGEERERIVTQKLASQDKVNKLLNDFISEMRHKIALGRRVDSNNMAYFHNQLKSVILPGDFDKVAENFYDISSLPKLKEKEEEEKLVYQVPAKKEPSEKTLEHAEEVLKEVMEQDADDKNECACEHECDCEYEDEGCKCVELDSDETSYAPSSEEGSGPEGISLLLIGKLEDIVYKLGSSGRHNEAYEVEKIIRDIRNFVSKNSDTLNK